MRRRRRLWSPARSSRTGGETSRGTASAPLCPSLQSWRRRARAVRRRSSPLAEWAGDSVATGEGARIASRGLSERDWRYRAVRGRGDTKTQADAISGQRWGCNGGAVGSPPDPRAPSADAATPDDLIVLAVRWHVRYRLSYADVVEWLAERPAGVDRRSTVYRWVRAPVAIWGDLLAPSASHGLGWGGRDACGSTAGGRAFTGR